LHVYSVTTLDGDHQHLSSSSLSNVSHHVNRIAGTSVAYTFSVTNTGNLKLRGLQLLVPAFAGNSSDSSISCTYTATNTAWPADSDLAAGATLSCAGSFSFDQDAIDAGDRSLAVTATAANLAAAATAPLPNIAVPNNPALSVSINAGSCQAPNNAGEVV
jgi:hypothetical protein